MNDKVDLVRTLAQFDEHGAPRTVARLNDYDVAAVRERVLAHGGDPLGTITRTRIVGVGTLGFLEMQHWGPA